jgi:hypothetical protein
MEKVLGQSLVWKLREGGTIVFAITETPFVHCETLFSLKIGFSINKILYFVDIVWIMAE